MSSAATLHPIPAFEWRERLDSHRQRARRWTVPTRERHKRGIAHPVEDFLFTYYFLSLKKLEQWHPGPGRALEAHDPLPGWLRQPPYRIQGGLVILDPPSAEKAARLRWIRDLLIATRDRPPNFSCHGLHEWAMVFTGTDIRHRESCPLRLPQEDIDALVRTRPICCSHFDAFRFFHPEARPLNRVQPNLDRRPELEQPGCIHANMDLYKWAAKALPWIDATLVLDAFELALELREIDMRASPYDLSEYGLTPIPIETETGRADYVHHQRRLAEKSAALRQRLIHALHP